MLKLKLPYSGHLMQRADSLEKTLMLGDGRQKEKREAEGEMFREHHRLNGHEFEPARGDREGQRSLACCSPWGHKESDGTWQLNSIATLLTLEMHLQVSTGIFRLVSPVGVSCPIIFLYCLLYLFFLKNMLHIKNLKNSGYMCTCSFQFSSVAQSCLTLCDPMDAAHQSSLSITNSQSLPKLTSIESVMPSNRLILCRPLLFPPSIFPSIRVFSNESALHIPKWPKYWSFSFNISPSNEHSGLISFWMDWLDLLAVQGTLKSLLQHHSSKASILWHSAFFTVQLSHPYMTPGKTVYMCNRVVSLYTWNWHNIVNQLRTNKKFLKYMLQTKSTSESAFRKLTRLYNLAGKERHWPRWAADRTSKERKDSDIHALVTWAQRRTCVEVWVQGYCVYQKSPSRSWRDLRSHWLKMQRRHLPKITVKCKSSTPQEKSESTLFWLRHQIPKARQTYFLKECALRRASPVAQQ